MELTNDFRVALPVERTWAILTDVERIAPCLPGAQLQEIEGDEYRGIVKVKVGPITVQYKGQATFLHRDEHEYRAVLRAEGRETRGQGNANAIITATLTPHSRGTSVSIVTDLTVTGRVAQFGRGVLADVSAKLLHQFVACLEQTVLADEPPASAASLAAAAKASQAAKAKAARAEKAAAAKAEKAEKAAAVAAEKAAAKVEKAAAVAAEKAAATAAKEAAAAAATSEREAAAAKAKAEEEAAAAKSEEDAAAAGAGQEEAGAGAMTESDAAAAKSEEDAAIAMAAQAAAAPDSVAMAAAGDALASGREASAEPAPMGDESPARSVGGPGSDQPGAPSPGEPGAWGQPSVPGVTSVGAGGAADEVTAAPAPESSSVPERSGVRRIESAEPEPVDLLGAAGSPVLRRVGPAVAVVAVLWLLKKLFGRRR